MKQLTPAMQITLWCIHNRTLVCRRNLRPAALRRATFGAVATTNALGARGLLHTLADSSFAVLTLTDAGRDWIREQIEAAHTEAKAINAATWPPDPANQPQATSRASAQ